MTSEDPVGRWEESTAGAWLHVTRVDPGAEVELRVRVAFGPLHQEWVEGPLLADDTGELWWQPVLGSDARLHELADEYVTDLRVEVVVLGDGERRRDLAEPAFVSFPSGPDRPVVWTAAQARVLAPRGVVDPDRWSALPPGTGRIRPAVPGVEPTVEVSP